jgi:hypothetical protein
MKFEGSTKGRVVSRPGLFRRDGRDMETSLEVILKVEDGEEIDWCEAQVKRIITSEKGEVLNLTYQSITPSASRGRRWPLVQVNVGFDRCR